MSLSRLNFWPVILHLQALLSLKMEAMYRGRLPFVDTPRKASSVSMPPSIRITRNQRSRSLPALNSNMRSTATEQSPSWQSRQKYRYAPLGPREIRRLRLVVAHNPDEPLHGVLETVPLSTYSPYTAISYVWGDNQQPFQMLVGKNQYIPLTASLDGLLRDLRKAASKWGHWKHANRYVTVIWVDQICINQEDDNEKARQVEMMASQDQQEVASLWRTGICWWSA